MQYEITKQSESFLEKWKGFFLIILYLFMGLVLVYLFFFLPFLLGEPLKDAAHPYQFEVFRRGGNQILYFSTNNYTIIYYFEIARYVILGVIFLSLAFKKLLSYFRKN
jgi:hypothetical protein